MKPSPELVLNQAFAKIAMEFGPALPPGYGQGSATLIAVLLLMVAQEFGRAAKVRAEENAAMRKILGDAVASVPAGLSTRLAAAAAEPDSDLSLAALDAGNARLKLLLIELHVHAETAGLSGIERGILAFLKGASAARQVTLPPM
jgi:hypothetical protein